MNIIKIKDYEYEVLDPVTKGKWVVFAGHELSDFGVMWAITDRLFNEGIRPREGDTVRVAFSFKKESSRS